MQFTPAKPFKLWLGDKLIAAYDPTLGYSVRDGDDMLRALVHGTELPGNEAATIEMPDLSQTEIQPGEVCPGWIKQGLVVMTGMKAGKVAGAAEVKKED